MGWATRWSATRNSRALFWIRDLRHKALPQQAREYLEDHYLHAGGDLYVLGFKTPAADDEPVTQTFEFIREGEYYIHRGGPVPKGRKRSDLVIDGQPLIGRKFYFEEKPYEIVVRAHSPEYVITPVKGSFFETDRTNLHFSMMFQYKATRSKRAPQRESNGESKDVPAEADRDARGGESADESANPRTESAP